ncbi:MAG: type III pantothenate kinase [bacterium]|nr:type III pantothenate kinase [bacterium]
MLFVIDAGNTNIVLGAYRGDDLVESWRIGTKKGRTADEYGILIRELLKVSGLDYKDIKDIILSSVVPPLDSVIIEMSEKYFNVKPMIVGPGLKCGIPILCENPKEVGADRIVNAVAVLKRFKGPVIVVDFGTATTFDLITAKGEYCGGVIAPGIGISIEALFDKASKLPKVDLVKPKKVIGKNTSESIQSGIIYGYVGLVEGIVAKIKEEAGVEAIVVATGGLAPLIAAETSSIDEVVDKLTLEGLKEIFELNRGRAN